MHNIKIEKRFSKSKKKFLVFSFLSIINACVFSL